MPIEIDLVFSRTSLICQESPYFLAKIKNNTNRPVTMPVLGIRPGMMRLKAFNILTGQESLTPPEGFTMQPNLAEIEIQPGETNEVRLRLLDLLDTLGPGKYEISAFCTETDQTVIATSKPVPVTVAPTTPRHLTLVNATGHISPILYGAWVGLADPPYIGCTRFNLVNGGIVDNAVPITKAKCSPHSRPQLSVSHNKSPLHIHWLAWTHDQYLWASHVHDWLGVTDPIMLKLPCEDTRIVPPLFSDPFTDPQSRPEGEVLLFSAPEGKTAFMQTARLTPEKISVEAVFPIAGPTPVWARSVVRSSGNRLTFYGQTRGQKSTMSMAKWPGIKNRVIPLDLTSVQGLCIGGTAEIAVDDVIHGAFLVITTEDSQKSMSLIQWKLDTQDQLKVEAPVTLKWNPMNQFLNAIIHMDTNMQPYVLITYADQTRQLLSGQDELPLPGLYQQGFNPLDFGFFGGHTDPILISGTDGLGFDMKQLDGTPLPEKFRM